MRQRGRRGREGPGIDPGCKATAAGWRSVVWSHSYGSLQQTLQAISKASLTPCNTPMKKGSRLKTRPSQDGLKNVYALILFFMSDTEGPAVPLPYAMKNTYLFFLLFLEFYLEHIGCQIGCDITFGDCSDCSRWSPELNQTKSKYLKGFQIYNFG